MSATPHPATALPPASAAELASLAAANARADLRRLAEGYGSSASGFVQSAGRDMGKRVWEQHAECLQRAIDVVIADGWKPQGNAPFRAAEYDPTSDDFRPETKTFVLKRDARLHRHRILLSDGCRVEVRTRRSVSGRVVRWTCFTTLVDTEGHHKLGRDETIVVEAV